MNIQIWQKDGIISHPFKDGEIGKVYRNGSLDNTNGKWDQLIIILDNELTGKLDTFRMFDKQLTYEEVAALLKGVTNINKTTTSVDIESQDVKKATMQNEPTPHTRPEWELELQDYITPMHPVMFDALVVFIHSIITQALIRADQEHTMLMTGLEAQIEQKAVIRASELVDKKMEEQRAEYVRKIKLQREYYNFGRRGDETHLNGYLDGLDFALFLLTQKKESK